MRKLLLIVLLFILIACDKNIDCNPGIGSSTSVSGSGIIVNHPGFGQLVIRHHVPGTIDSFNTYIPCNLSSEFTEGMEINYAGMAEELDEKHEPLTQIAGEEFFTLFISSAEEVI